MSQSENIKIFYVYTSVWYKGTDQDAYDRCIREKFIVGHTRNLGYSSQLLMLTYNRDVIRMSDKVGGILFPVDNPTIIDSGKHTSVQLLKYIEKERPVFIIFKGMGNLLSRWLIAKSSHSFRWGFIVGGRTNDIALRFSDYVLAEHDFQIRNFFYKYYEKDFADILPKLLNKNDFYESSESVKEFDIVSVGRLSKHKNYEALIPFFEKYNVALIGDGPCYDELKKIADFYPNVYMPGSLSRKDVLNIIKRSRLFVHPCRWEQGLEGFPRAIAESFSCSVPVIVLRKTIPSGFEHGVHGLMVDEEEFEASVHSLLNDRAKLNQMGKNAYIYAKANFSENAVKKTINKMYDRINSSNNSSLRKSFKSVFSPLYIRSYEKIWYFKSLVFGKMKQILGSRRTNL